VIVTAFVTVSAASVECGLKATNEIARTETTRPTAITPGKSFISCFAKVIRSASNPFHEIYCAAIG
jgi:hypothetical protein